MRSLNTSLDRQGKQYRERRNFHTGLRDELRNRLEKVQAGGPEDARAKHLDRGKLLARDRINLLLDPGTPFLELSPLAAGGQYEDQFPSAGLVSGIGVVQGKEVMIVANDATVKGGTYVKETIRKHLRAQEIAMQNHLPCIYLVDSGGIFLPVQAEVFPDRDDFGRIFYMQARLSALGIPQVSVVMGSCTAGGAYVPAMSDESIIVEGQGTIFLAGPPLVKAATGEDVSAEELGGGRVHAQISGVADHLARNDEDALRICREIFESIQVPARQKLDLAPPREPLYPAEDLYGLIPSSTREAYDVREIIARLVDGSEFAEFKKDYGTTLVCGFARIMGYPVGIVANNGVLFSESSLKGTHFVDLCDRRGLPLIFLQNISGFMVGKEYEHGGIAKDGAKMVSAVANTRVPRFTVIIGGSFGAGNYAMSGRAYDPHLLIMWPNARISVMGGEQAADVLATLKEEQMKARGKSLGPEDREALRKPILEKYEHEGSAWYSTSRLWDDGVIDPAQTRDILAMALSMSLNKKFEEPRSGIYRM